MHPHTNNDFSGFHWVQEHFCNHGTANLESAVEVPCFLRDIQPWLNSSFLLILSWCFFNNRIQFEFPVLLKWAGSSQFCKKDIMVSISTSKYFHSPWTEKGTLVVHRGIEKYVSDRQFLIYIPIPSQSTTFWNYTAVVISWKMTDF